MIAPLPRIILADDHAMLLDAFQRLLEPRCEILGTAGDGHSLLKLVKLTRPDIVILDISMPQLNGLDAGSKILREFPDVRLIYLTVNEDPGLAAEAFLRGASGYLLKNSAASELFSAVENAMAGRKYITPLVTKGLPFSVFLHQAHYPREDKLTPRQREVLQLLAEGRPMKEVAALLQITTRTVAFHKYSIMEQLEIKTSAELVRYALEHRLVGTTV